MTAIDVFKAIDDADRKVNTAQSRVDLFKSLAERITCSLEGEVVSRTRNVHSHEDAIIKLSEAKEELTAASERYQRLLGLITETMSRLDEPEDEMLLTRHHLQHLSLSEAAKEMHRSRAWAYKRHAAALYNLDRLLQTVHVENYSEVY